MFYKKADYKNLCNKSSILSTTKFTLNSIVADTLFHTVYKVSFKNSYAILKVAKYLELKDSLKVEKYIYENNLTNLSIKVLDCNFEDMPYLLLEFAKGKCLEEIPLNSNNFPKVIQNLKNAIISYSLPLKDTKKFGTLTYQSNKLEGSFTKWSEYILSNLEDHLSIVHKYIPSFIMKLIEQSFYKEKNTLDDNITPCLLHSDLGRHNIFVDGSDITSIIDWEDACSGDTLFDYANFASFSGSDLFIPILLQNLDQEQINKFWKYYLRILIAKGVVLLNSNKPIDERYTRKLNRILQNSSRR